MQSSPRHKATTNRYCSVLAAHISILLVKSRKRAMCVCESANKSCGGFYETKSEKHSCKMQMMGEGKMTFEETVWKKNPTNSHNGTWHSCRKVTKNHALTAYMEVQISAVQPEPGAAHTEEMGNIGWEELRAGSCRVEIGWLAVLGKQILNAGT